MTAEDLIQYWKTIAKEDLETAEDLFKLKRYCYCLFFCHLAIEKLLKGLIFKKTNQHAPPIHDIGKLVRKTELQISSELKKELVEITTWNIRARYDNYKREFYKKADKKFSTFWFNKAKEIYQWIKNQY